MQAELRKAFANEDLRQTWIGLGTEPPNLYGEGFWPVRGGRDAALGRGRQALRRTVD